MSTTATGVQNRPIVFKTKGFAASDGAGVNLRRMIGTPELDMLDPFLMLDWFHSDEPDDYLAGFPDHPHRGFETVTFIVNGRMRHHDNKGHEGVIEPGGIQWMTAGSGIVHSEMPEQEDGLLSGFQLWINLPAAEKMSPAAYQEFDRSHIPVDERDGAALHLIAGRTEGGASGPVVDRPTEPFYADIHLQPGVRLSEALPADHSAFVMVYDGTITLPASAGVGDGTVSMGELAVLGYGAAVDIGAGPQGAKFLLVAAKPLGEPVARAGPFVMNTEAELHQAFTDFRAGRM